MKIRVADQRIVLGEFSTFPNAQEAVHRHLDEAFGKDSHKEIRQVHMGEHTDKGITSDKFRYFRNTDRELVKPLMEISFTYLQ